MQCGLVLQERINPSDLIYSFVTMKYWQMLLCNTIVYKADQFHSAIPKNELQSIFIPFEIEIRTSQAAYHRNQMYAQRFGIISSIHAKHAR